MSGIESPGKARKRERPRAGRPAGPPPPERAERLATGDEPDRLDEIRSSIQDASAAIPKNISGVAVKPANPYAPTGWKGNNRKEFDLALPSGTTCRVMRFERDDLFRLGLMDYLDTFTPVLLEDMTDEERDAKVQEIIAEDPTTAITKLYTAIDKVAMACCLKPRLTEDPELADPGTESDWEDPNFIATIPITWVPQEERMFIFGAAFGKSMDDLKSLFPEEEGVGSMDDGADVREAAE